MSAFQDGTGRCDLKLWDDEVRYEGALVKLEGGEFTAHIREAGRKRAGVAGGRRVSMPFVAMYRHFCERPFRATLQDCEDAPVFDAEVYAVQRSSMEDFEYFVCGRFKDLEPVKPAAEEAGDAGAEEEVVCVIPVEEEEPRISRDDLEVLSVEDAMAELTPIGL